VSKGRVTENGMVDIHATSDRRIYRQESLMKLSARNQLKGKIVGVTKGQTTAHVRIDIGAGVIVTSSITNEAVDDLALKVGDDAFAVIKASDVMVAK
jgi:molybdopterin-binding protein